MKVIQIMGKKIMKNFFSHLFHLNSNWSSLNAISSWLIFFFSPAKSKKFESVPEYNIRCNERKIQRICRMVVYYSIQVNIHFSLSMNYEVWQLPLMSKCKEKWKWKCIALIKHFHELVNLFILNVSNVYLYYIPLFPKDILINLL